MHEYGPLRLFDDGVDRKALTHLRSRLLALAELRRQRWSSLASERQRHFLEILPLLLDVNHPMLPGYVGADCPHRLQSYTPTPEAERLLHAQVRSFRWRASAQPAALQALYLMGSCGSIAQTADSDLDIWVCIAPSLTALARQRLQDKLARIEAYAATQGIQAHFFQMQASDFRQGQSHSLSHEDCGATQHILLLDEFYRSALWLAGAWPLWWFIPAEEESRYEQHARHLLAGRYLRAEQVIDLGAVDRVPDEEFLGAGMWQLFKGLAQPIKAVLKILLAEVYAAEQPQVGLLSLLLKQRLHALGVVDELDPYLLLYDKVAAYLQARGDSARLHLVRQCFYLKANVHLSREPVHSSWRHQLLQRIVQAWGWTHSELALLDSREQWRFRPLQGLHERLVSEIWHAYRLLEHQFNSKGQAPSPALQQDLIELRRRLDAAYTPRAGKITWRQPYLAGDFLEERLHLHEGDDGRWTLTETPAMPPLYHAGSALAALVWAISNGLADAHTQWQLQASHLRRQELELLAYRLAGALADLRQDAGAHDLAAAPRWRRLILVLNHAQGPADTLARRGLARIAGQGDVLAYGGLRVDLLQRIDAVLINHWCEIELRSFQGEQALIRCCLELLPEFAGGGDLQVIQASPGPSPGSLSSRVDELFRGLCRRMMSAREGLYLLRTGTRFHLLHYTDTSVEHVELAALTELAGYLRRPDWRGLDFAADARSLRDELLGRILARRDGAGYWYESVCEDEICTWVDDGRALFMAPGAAARASVRSLLRRLVPGVTAIHLERAPTRSDQGFSAPEGLIEALYRAIELL